MKNASVNIYDVQVIFDAEARRFSYMGDVVATPNPSNPSAPGVSIPIAPGIQIINFTLDTISGSGATFQFYPINWVGTPELQPAYGLGQWFDSTHCRLVVFNTHTSTSTASYGFVVTVMYEGAAYTSPDPTIINEPPVQ